MLKLKGKYARQFLNALSDEDSAVITHNVAQISDTQELHVATVPLTTSEELQLNEQLGPRLLRLGCSRNTSDYKEYRALEDQLWDLLEQRLELAASAEVDAEEVNEYLQRTFQTSIHDVFKKWQRNARVQVCRCFDLCSLQSASQFCSLAAPSDRISANATPCLCVYVTAQLRASSQLESGQHVQALEIGGQLQGAEAGSTTAVSADLVRKGSCLLPCGLGQSRGVHKIILAPVVDDAHAGCKPGSGSSANLH